MTISNNNDSNDNNNADNDKVNNTQVGKACQANAVKPLLQVPTVAVAAQHTDLTLLRLAQQDSGGKFEEQVSPRSQAVVAHTRKD